jgi:uncharacterized Zn finger protein
MAEYNCPKCKSSKITAVRETVRGSEQLLMILCEDCGHFIGVVNDLTKVKEAIRNIAVKVGTGCNL